MISKRIVSAYINIALCTIYATACPKKGEEVYLYSLSYKVDFLTAFIDNMSGFKIYVYVYIDSKLWHCDHGDDALLKVPINTLELHQTSVICLFNFIFKWLTKTLHEGHSHKMHLTVFKS